jgi:hypothetical protein
MVSADPQAISAVLTAPSTATTQDHPGLAAAAERPTDWTSEWFVYLVPDISDETAAAITKAKAWPAFNAVFRHLRRCHRRSEAAGRKGDEAAGRRAAACQAGVLDDEGIRGLARSIGTTPKAMSRQIAALQALGILAAFRPPASMTRDPDTGRIVRRPAKAGRVEAARIVLTLGDDHRRPANRQGFDRPSQAPGRTKAPKATKGRLRVDPTPSADDPKGRSDTTPISPFPISPSAKPAAAEAGRQAEDAARRPDGRRGGQRPPGQDRGRVGGSDTQRPPNAATEATPTPPAGTESGTHVPVREDTGPAGHLDRPDRQDRTEAAPPGADTSDLRRGRPAANASQADSSGMDPSLGSWLDAYRQAIGRPAAQATTADEAADRLRRSLDELPDESRQRAADLGQDMADIEDEARRLAEIVQRRQRDEDATAKVEAKARSEGHRQAWHRKRAKATSAA